MEQLGADAVEAASFAPGGGFVLTAAKDHTIRWWDVSSGREVRRIPINSGDTNDYFFSLDGKYLLTGEEENRARLWNVTTGEEVQAFSVEDSGVELVALSPNGKVAAGATYDEVKFWDVSSGKEVGRISSNASAIAFSPNGQLFLIATKEEALLLDLNTGKISERLVGSSRLKTTFTFETGKSTVAETPQGAYVNQVQFSNDGQYVLTGSSFNGVLLWNLTTGQVRSPIYG
jgi:WD40 repeat protein